MSTRDPIPPQPEFEKRWLLQGMLLVVRFPLFTGILALAPLLLGWLLAGQDDS
jgi:hypothetical protein